MASFLRTALFSLGFVALGASATVALDAVAGPAGPGLHQRGPGHPGPKVPGAGLAKAMAQLDLTDAQQTALEELREDVITDMKAMHALQEASKGDVAAQLISGELSREQVHASLDEAAEARVALAHEILDRILDIHATLTPAQQVELRDLIEEGQARRAERMERRESMQGDEDAEGRRHRRGSRVR